VRSRVHGAKPGKDKTTECVPGLSGIPDGVLPAYFPSSVISAPEGIEEKLHITFPATAFCAGRLGGGGAASGVASDAFCPGATATACGGGSGRGCALLDSPFGCASAAGAAPGVVGSSPANLYNRVPSLPFEFGTQTVMPCFPLRAS